MTRTGSDVRGVNFNFIVFFVIFFYLVFLYPTHAQLMRIPQTRKISTAFFALKPNVPSLLTVSNINVCRYPCWSETSPSPSPPLVLLGGTASVIDSWQAHVKPLSRNRDVLCVEALGQGRSEALDCSMSKQVAHMQNALEDLGVEEVDIAGVSFGGRLGVALAKAGGGGRTRVRKLHVTGVGVQRDEQALRRIERWRAMLGEEGGLETFSEDLIKSSYSKVFLEKVRSFGGLHVCELILSLTAAITQNEKNLGKFVEFVVSKNTREGLARLICQSHAAVDDEFGVRER